MAKKTKETRDDFSPKTIRLLRERVSDLCSKPDCKVLTRGASSNQGKATSVGVAAHITAAASGAGAARYDASLSSEQRKHYDNGIWLCQTCSRLIDVDENRFPVSLLKEWKKIAEQYSEENIGKQLISSFDSSAIKSLIEDSINKKGNAEADELRKKLGVTEQALTTFFTILKKKNIPTESLPTVLCEIALRHRESLHRLEVLSEGNSEYQTKITEVHNAIQLGKYSSAIELLLLVKKTEEEIAHKAKEVRKAAQESEDKHFLNAANAAAEIAELELIELNYDQAAEYFHNANELTPSKFTLTKTTYLVYFASAIYKHGIEKGVNECIKTSINTYLQILKLINKENYSQRWASIQDNLGTAFSELGGRTGDKSLFNESVKFYNAALEVFSIENTPQLWASTQNNLASVYAQIGDFTSDVDQIEKALVAYNNSLKVRDSISDPKSWAITKQNIGGLYLTLSKFKSDTQILHNAINAFTLANKVFISINDKESSALVHTNLGLAFFHIARDTSDIKYLDKANSSYQKALNILEKEKKPMHWASIQDGLGSIFSLYYKLTNNESYLKKSENSYCKALAIRGPDSAPIVWAKTHNNLANTYKELGKKQSSTNYFEKALHSYNQALSILTITTHPRIWAEIQNNLGHFFIILGKKTTNNKYYEEAIKSFENALEVKSYSKYPTDWADIQNNLGIVFGALGRHSDAVTAYTESLKVRTIESSPIEWADTQNNLGASYKAIGLNNNSIHFLELAVIHFSNARTEYSNIKSNCIVSEENLGGVLSILGIFKKDKNLLIRAIDSAQKVKDFYKRGIKNKDSLEKAEQHLIRLTAELNKL